GGDVAVLGAVFRLDEHAAVAGEAVVVGPLDDRAIVAGVVDRALEVAIDATDADREVVGQLLLRTEDVLVLVHRIQILRGDGFRVLADAELVVQVAVRTTVGRVVDLVEAGRCAGHRIDAGELVVLLDEQRGAGTTHRDGGGQRQRIASGVTEHLQRGVAVDVPGEAQTRRELVLDLDVGFAVAVLVVEGIPAGAAVQHEVVADAPAVFQVVGGLVDTDGGAGLEHAQTRHVGALDIIDRVAAVAPELAAGV